MARNETRPRVLLADDYADLLTAFTRLLTPSYEVVGCVADGDAAVERVAPLRPDVVVVDLFIPPSNGFDVCRRVKDVAPGTVVIIVSASADAHLAEAAHGAGASAFVNKAEAGRALVPAIQRALAARSA